MPDDCILIKLYNYHAWPNALIDYGIELAIPFLKRNNLKLKIWDIVFLTVLVRVLLIVYILQDNWIIMCTHTTLPKKIISLQQYSTNTIELTF